MQPHLCCGGRNPQLSSNFGVRQIEYVSQDDGGTKVRWKSFESFYKFGAELDVGETTLWVMVGNGVNNVVINLVTLKTVAVFDQGVGAVESDAV